MRVLRILTRGNVGGPMRQALGLWGADADAGLQTLLAVGACPADETQMPRGGIPDLEPSNLTPDSRGFVSLSRLGRAARPWRDVLATRELRRIIQLFRPDVVHTHTSQAGFFGRRAAIAEGVPVIAHTFHGHVLTDYYAKPVSALFRRLEARLARRTDALFAVSESCRLELEALRVGEGRIEVLPPAVDLAAFAQSDRVTARAALGLSDGDFAIGMVGRLVPIKRPELFVQLVAMTPGVQGFVFGDGPLRERMARRSGARLHLRGATPDMERYLAGLDALVLCSKREGCPLVAIEAFAAGVPVIGLDVPGVSDVLGEWGAGLSVPENAGVEGLARAVTDLQQDPTMAVEIVERGRLGLARFDSRAVASRLRERYAAAREGRGEVLVAG